LGALRPAVRAAGNGWEAPEVVLAALSRTGQGIHPGGVPALWRLAAATPADPAGTAMTVAELAARWREEADAYARDGATGHAAVLGRVAAELDEALRRQALEELPIAQAAVESGYSTSQLRRRFPGQRTIRRADLPRKGGQGGPDLAGAILRAARA
jgi:hypothetical protein